MASESDLTGPCPQSATGHLCSIHHAPGVCCGAFNWAQKVPEMVNSAQTWVQAQAPAPNFILPTASAERKKVPLWSGLFRYFPDALVAMARLSWKGNEKHNPGQPLNWSRGKSNDHEDCLLRHLMDIGTGEVDPDTGELHEVEVLWRAAAICQLALERQRQGGKR